MAVWAGEGGVRHVYGVDGGPHVRVVQGVVSAIPISVQRFGEERGDGRLVGDYGVNRRIKNKRKRIGGWRPDMRSGENVLSGVVRKGGAAAMNLIHECADPRKVCRGIGTVVEKGGLGEGGPTKRRRRFI